MSAAQQPAPHASALAGIRVAELGEGAGLAYAGKLFADLGAEVVKLEAAEGDPLRRLPPLVEVAPNTEGEGQQESGWFAWLNTNKRSLTATPERIAAILAASDVLLDGRPVAEQLAPASGHAALRAAHPNLHIISLSWFGLSGPYRDFAATDSTMRALAGLVKNTGPVERPAMMPDYQGFAPQGLTAFTAACAALWSGSAGRLFEISAHDANAVISEYQAVITFSPGPPEQRRGINRWHPTFPMGCYPCKEGWLGITVLTPDQWRNWCAMLGTDDLAEDPRFATSPQRLEAADELEASYRPILLTRTAREWFEEGLRRRIPLVMVPSMADLLAEPVHQGRGAFGTVTIGSASFQAPVIPQRLNDTPPTPGGTAPRAGADNAMPLPEPRPRPRPRVAAPAPANLPLAGLRIVDMAMGWAGPLTTRQMADLGAEIIKIEGRAYPDWWRGHDYSDQSIKDHVYETRLNFNALNRNKHGITLDLTRPEGADLARKLVMTADAVVENYSQGVLPKLGLDYPNLVKIKPDLVMVTMPAYAAGTAWAETRAYGSTLEQGSGLPSITGEEGWPPTMNHVAGGDPNGGFNAAAALIAALLHRKRTGQGQLIDLSQVECMLPLAASGIIHQSVHGTPGPRWGNRHPLFVPHGAFRCRGTDAWLVVAVTSDTAFRRLCHIIGRPDLGDDPTLATAAGRRVRAAELEAAITNWTETQPPDDAMAELQAKGIAAGVARGFNELITGETHLLARGFWQEIDRPILGRHWQPTPTFRENARPYAIRTPAPTLGQYTREVLARILNLSKEQLDRLEEARIIGETPIPASERAPRSAARLREATQQKA